mmetsp:Transcript_31082/g.65028  ORF Transcript_31082/g.65028 Transcript_31082/m.65028 type:complete len:233 (+) Transcript_31082:56-754(+)
MSSKLLVTLVGSATSRLAASSLRANNPTHRIPTTRLFPARFSSTSTDAATPSPTSTTSDATSTDESSSDLKTGIVKSFFFRKQFGIIREANPPNPDEPLEYFIHCNDILRYDTSSSSSDQEVKYVPLLKIGQSVEFKVAPPDDGKKLSKAYDLTLKGGEKVAPFSSKYFERFERSQKARFGDEVFEIMSTSSDQHEMESKIVAAFERVRERIESKKRDVDIAKKLVEESDKE